VDATAPPYTLTPPTSRHGARGATGMSPGQLSLLMGFVVLPSLMILLPGFKVGPLHWDVLAA